MGYCRVEEACHETEIMQVASVQTPRGSGVGIAKQISIRYKQGNCRVHCSDHINKGIYVITTADHQKECDL